MFRLSMHNHKNSDVVRIFSCFDKDVSLFDKCNIQSGDNSEIIKEKISQFFQQSVSDVNPI